MGSRFNRRMGLNQASDGFFLNLSWIMLHLCSPFMTNEWVDSKRKNRIAAIDVTYCAVQNKALAVSIDEGGALIDFSTETKLVPSSES